MARKKKPTEKRRQSKTEIVDPNDSLDAQKPKGKKSFQLREKRRGRSPVKLAETLDRRFDPELVHFP